ncbi:hypothetical protein FF011L_22750 [Roseimaritima multifibrata]|uniref:50S ribosomal protein L17 n=1 Tax=Roseimaritima multifibrata TaxID=1930274 RepID=A0A517MF37_9BACT|nr:DUF6800 family protein [Roseimaritima multifibrata]QDS93505.1 hypothetical protein FF011L_22750 [Roseimaritima multifibrata]
MAGTERRRELRRRRKRVVQTKKLLARAANGTMEKSTVIRKLRRMTTGADAIIEREKLNA